MTSWTSSVQPAAPASTQAARPGSRRGTPWRALGNPAALFGAGVVTLLIVVAMTAPWLAPYPPQQIDLARALAGPHHDHLLGTDQFGRDLLSRIIWGSRVSLLVSVVGVGIALALGGCLGLVSGLLGGTVDLLTMRLVDVLLSFPALLIALLIVAIFKPGLGVVMSAVGVAAIPNFARLVRAEVLAIREREYVLAARAAGAGVHRVAVRHVAPNLVSAITVMATSLFATAIITESNLSFLGLGVPQDVTSWGSMVHEGQTFLLTDPLVATLPGLAIVLAVAGVNFLGDYLRDLLDPRLNRDQL